MDWALALIAATPPTIAAVAALVAARRALTSIHLELNSRLDELIATTRAEADAVGEARGRADERSRTPQQDQT